MDLFKPGRGGLPPYLAGREHEHLDGAELEAAVGRGLGGQGGEDRTAATARALGHLGYIWRPDAAPTWEAGIPSLMDYVQVHHRGG